MKKVKCLPEFEYFTVFLKNRNFISKTKISKVTDYAALINVESIAECSLLTCIKQLLVLKTIFGLCESGRFTQVLLYMFVS